MFFDGRGIGAWSRTLVSARPPVADAPAENSDAVRRHASGPAAMKSTSWRNPFRSNTRSPCTTPGRGVGSSGNENVTYRIGVLSPSSASGGRIPVAQPDLDRLALERRRELLGFLA